jgi:transcription antitermination factor NusG
VQPAGAVLSPGGVRWHALFARSRAEFRVRAALDDLGVEAWLPTFVDRVRWTDREKQTTRPLFPGYLFARFAYDARGDVLAIAGVVTILSLDQQPVAIPDAEISNLRRVVESPAAVRACPYVAGAAVRVLRGPFAGVFGVVQGVKNDTILSIPVQILGRAVAVRIDARDVAPALVAAKVAKVAA